MKKVLLLLFLTVFSVSMASAQKRVKKAPARFTQGDFAEWIYSELKFPKLALADRMTGIVKASFKISEEGELCHLKIESTPHAAISQELRCVMQESPAWGPEVKNSRPILSEHTIQIDFSRLLSEDQLKEMTVVESFHRPVFETDGSYSRGLYEALPQKVIAAKNDSIDEFKLIIGIAADGSVSALDFETESRMVPAIEEKIVEYTKDLVWEKPAMVNGAPHPYHIYYNMATISSVNEATGVEEAFIAMEQKPIFNGADLAEFRRWVKMHFKYPDEARDRGISGRVIAQFVVERDGSISSVSIVQSAHPSLHKELERVLKSAPKWTPGYQKGKPVRIKYTLPIEFKIRDRSSTIDAKTPPNNMGRKTVRSY